MKFIGMGLYPYSVVPLDNIILTLFELQSSKHAFLLSTPNHIGNLQHTKSQTNPSEVNALKFRERTHSEI